MRIQIGDASIYYEVEGQGPPLLLVHGGGVDLETWEDMVPLLRGAFTVYRCDLRGFGRSATPEGGVVRAEHWIEDLRGFVTALSLDPVAVAGWALGGCLAAGLAGRHPELVSWIAMIGSPGPTRQPGMSGIRARENLIGAGASADEIVEETFEFTRSAFSPAALERDPQVADRLKLALKRNFRRNYAELMLAFADAITTSETLRKVRCPSLVVVGEHDVRTPVEMSVDIAKALEHAYLRVFRDCGHFYGYEQPQRTAEALIDFHRFATVRA
jgi:pimeloyl-ACP methyl ester carboxylesterase